MARKIRMGSEAFQCAIEGKMTIYMAGELREAILPAITCSQEIEIDLSRVTEIDLAGVLLMMEAKLVADKQGRELHFVGHSQPVIEILDLCNLGGFFGAHVHAL